MCNIVAIAGTVHPTTTLKKLVLQCFLIGQGVRFTSLEMFCDILDQRFGIEVPEAQLQRVLDLLQQEGRVVLSQGAYILPTTVRSELHKCVKEATELEARVREEWLNEVSSRYPELELEQAWASLQAYLAKVFRRHGVHAVRLLDPAFANDPEHDRSLGGLLEEALANQAPKDYVEACRAAILDFLNEVVEYRDRVKYISQLADAAYAYFSLAIPPEVSAAFRQRLEGLVLFFDTNVLFALLDLDARFEPVARRLTEAVTQDRLPFRLRYHTATAEELRETIDYQAERLRGRAYPKGQSRAAANSGQLVGVALRYHQKNAEVGVTTDAFLKPYEYPDLLLKERGLDVYRTDGVPAELLKMLEYEYQAFLTELGREKSVELIRHDATVLATSHHIGRQQTSSLALGALLVTLDHRLYRFDQRVSRDKGLKPRAVLLETFLQILRPYLTNSKRDYDVAFAQAFTFHEFRTVGSGASDAATQVINLMAGYTGIREETASRMLSNSMLLERIAGARDSAEAREVFEHFLENDHAVLAEEVVKLRKEEEHRRLEKAQWTSELEQERDDRERREKELLEKISASEREKIEVAQAAAAKVEAAKKAAQAKLTQQHQEQKDKDRIAQERFDALEQRLEVLEEFPQKLSRSKAENYRLRVVVGASLGLLVALTFLLAVHVGPLTWVRSHGNTWTIQAAGVLGLISLMVGFFVPTWRPALWSVFGLGLIVAVVQALGGPGSMQGTSPNQIP